MARIILKVPKAAVSMQEGTLVEWFVDDGETVSVGQPLYSIETEKSALEIESPFAGTIKRIGLIGQTYQVGAPIAEITQ